MAIIGGDGSNQRLVLLCRQTEASMWINLNSKRRVVVVALPLLSDPQLERAFVVADDNALWRATLQLIETMVEEAGDAAESAVGNHGISASCNGGAEHLKLLRTRMFDLRQKGIKRQRNPEEK